MGSSSAGGGGMLTACLPACCLVGGWVLPAARPTLVSNMLTQYMNNLVPAFPAPVYANMKDNFFM